MSNAITQRIADFLKEYEPFNFLSYDDLISITNSIRVINLEKHKSLFQINDKLHDCFYVVASGVIHLTIISDADETLLNKCYPGDIFGLRPFFAKNNYQMTAKAREESIVYAIPIATFKPFVAQNQEVLTFLLESFAINTKNPSDSKNSGKLLSDSAGYSDNQSDMLYFQSLNYNKTPLKISSDSNIKETAQLMTENLADSALIIEQNFPIGIVTDCDFRSKVATGRFPMTHAIEKIMSSPVITVVENISVAEAQLVMLKHDVTHLCVTFDGTDKSDIKGIISEHDLVVAQANNPGILLKELKRSQSSKDLKQVRDKLSEIIQASINKNIPLVHINNIAGEITLAIIKRAVELAILELGSPPARFAWLSIGSQGRKEQLLLTDQDNILVFEDVVADKYRDVKDYFIKLAKKTTATLEKTGYPICPNSHIASNLMWCKSLTDWTKQYNSWMNTPGENSNEISSVFFDYEMAFGELKLEDAITEIIFKNAKNNVLFFDYLGNDALNKPTPLNFFKKFNVEEDGPNKGKFDIKTKALMPLIDGARMFVLSNNIKGINNTYLRYKQLSITDPKHSETYLNCAEAFVVLSKFKTLEGLKNDSSGQFIDLDELSKVDKEKLKNALAPMKELEEMIKDRFQLTQFS
ncbi:MAG: cyclic nucleotide-binding domain-containing protein [Flavobacterium sp.]|nr:cyclic nucleotide-binding domain-containing protein [Flavobacterium sp.]